jgi:hypothetical protein
MARPPFGSRNSASAQSAASSHERRCYVLVLREDCWFIAFAGEEFGPYKDEREARLFAIDAAHKLGENGHDTQVLVSDGIGGTLPIWTHGFDPYPMRH